jgi:molybdopterin converting factor small subunit
VKISIMPGFLELMIIINPTTKVKRKTRPMTGGPELFAPWPGAKRKGIVETEVAGTTLRELFTEIGYRYKKANVDFEPIDQPSKQLDSDYDVWLNKNKYSTLSDGLDTRLKDNDEVRVRILWRWDG